jgi:hypothetical protein
MGFTETLVFYVLVGAAVAVAVFLTSDRRRLPYSGFLSLSAIFFWPLYLPLLLSARSAPRIALERRSEPQPDEMAAAIAQVEMELDAALSSLDGWAEDALAGEEGRIAELRHALAAQAARIREMDGLLARTESSRVEAYQEPGSDVPFAHNALDRCNKSQQARAQNLARLAQVRRQAHADLMATLAWIRELVSMIHLAKFTGAPASRAEELVAQIAAAVEGISAVTWQESEPPPPEAIHPAKRTDEWLTATSTATARH